MHCFRFPQKTNMFHGAGPAHLSAYKLRCSEGQGLASSEIPCLRQVLDLFGIFGSAN